MPSIKPRSKPPCIVGMDPGYAALGLSAVRVINGQLVPAAVALSETKSGGKKRTVRKSSEDLARINVQMAALDQWVTSWQPKALVAEVPASGAKSAAAMKGLAFATALIAYVVRRYELPLIQLYSLDIKQAWVGDKKAGKPEMIAKARDLYGNIPGWPNSTSDAKLEHPADALAAVFAAIDDPIITLLRNAS